MPAACRGSPNRARTAALGWRRTFDEEDQIVLEPPKGSPEDGLVPDLLFLRVPEGNTTVSKPGRSRGGRFMSRRHAGRRRPNGDARVLARGDQDRHGYGAWFPSRSGNRKGHAGRVRDEDAARVERVASTTSRHAYAPR
jgi:hypothetical protein